MNWNGGFYKRGLISLLAALTVGLGVSSSSVSAQEEAPVPAPPPTQEPIGLGTDGHLDNLASNCYGGSMQACDDLYDESPPGSPYQLYGDTCAGRQAAETGLYCTNVFLDAGAAATTVAAPATTVTPTATSGAVSMTAIARPCIPQAIAGYTERHAARVAPSEQGVLAARATEEGMGLDAYLTSRLDSLNSTTDDPATRLVIVDPWVLVPASSRVGDANTTEWGLLAGVFSNCIFDSIEIPDTTFDSYIDSSEGSATWTANGIGYGMDWSIQTFDDGTDHFIVLIRLIGADQTATTVAAPAPTTTTAGPSPSTTMPATQPTEAPAPPLIPAPTLDPTTLGTDETLNALAESCHAGDMAACDELFEQSPAGSPYENFGDTCAGRQIAGRGVWCQDAFGQRTGTSGPGPDATGTTQPASAPSTTLADATLTGAGPGGDLAAAPVCPPGTRVQADTTQNGVVCGCAFDQSNGMPCGAEPIVPPGTTLLALDGGQCNELPEATELEGYFTDRTQMSTLAECFIPWLDEWAESLLTVPSTPNGWIYIPTDVQRPEYPTDRLSTVTTTTYHWATARWTATSTSEK